MKNVFSKLAQATKNMARTTALAVARAAHAATSAENDAPLVNERKMVADGVNFEAARAALDSFCLPDGEFPEGDISSVYFDTPDLAFLAEKENGDNLKSKVRLRWYDGGSGEIPAFLEIKLRVGAARDKFRFRIRADAETLASAPLDGGVFPALLAEAARGWGELGAAVPPGLMPVLCVSYKRRRYVCPFTGSRVALDSGIHSGRRSAAFFATPEERLDAPEVVCEFKNNTLEMPPWLRALQGNGFRLRSFSKYGRLAAYARDGF